jgi:hypothetical protein
MFKRLPPEQQKAIGQKAISESNISHIAQYHQVSRNTVYAQQRRAQSAMNDEFLASTPDDKVLFHIPITKVFLHQMVIALLMICKASYRDCILFMRDVFDTEMCIGTIFNIHETACQKAISLNACYRLESIRQSASDEIFHRNKPILAVVDIRSRYCASLTLEDCRDAETWAIHLLEPMSKGFKPDVNISDLGTGMTKAFKDVLSDTEHRFDHFHLIKASKELVRYLKNQKESAVTRQIRVLEKMDKAKKKGKGNTLSIKLNQASRETMQTESLYQHVSILCSWLQHDILQLGGHNPEDREKLFDFVLAELSSVTALSPRIQSFVASLSNQKECLLAASHVLNCEFQLLSVRFDVTLQDVWDVCYVTRYDIQTLSYHNQSDALASRLGPRFEMIEDEVLKVIATTPRCSSMVENFNSRLRPYLDARKQVTQKSLELIRFYLNHQVFLRSQHDYLQGKSPAEALTESSHPNWLEMLGFKRFKRLNLAA